MNKSMLISCFKLRFRSPAIASTDPSCELCRPPTVPRSGGMTLLETVVAMTMLVAFTGVVVLVMEFTNRFFVDVEGGERVDISGNPVWGKGVVVEHAEIQIIMDRLVEILSQSGMSTQVKAVSSAYSSPIPPMPPTCVGSVESDKSLKAYFAADIAAAWNLPIPALRLPRGYSLCLWSTDPPETASSPGIYVLQALPDKVSASQLPTRRIFCRPRHLC